MVLILARRLLAYHRSSLESINLILPRQHALFMTLKIPRSKGGGSDSIQFAQADRKEVLLFEGQEHLIRKSGATSLLEEGTHLPSRILLCPFHC